MRGLLIKDIEVPKEYPIKITVSIGGKALVWDKNIVYGEVPAVTVEEVYYKGNPVWEEE